MSLDLPGLPRISNVVGPIPFTNGQSGAFQIMCNINTGALETSPAPIQIYQDGGQIVQGMEVYNYGNYFTGFETDQEQYNMVLMLSSVGDISLQGGGTFTVLGFVPPAGGSSKTGFFIQGETMYYLPDCSIPQPYPKNYIVGYVPYFTDTPNSTSYNFFALFGAVQNLGGLFRQWYPNVSTDLMSGTINFKFTRTYTDPDNGFIQQVITPIFYNNNFQYYGLNYMESLDKSFIEEEPAGPSGEAYYNLFWETTINQVQYFYNVPTPGYYVQGGQVSGRSTTNFNFEFDFSNNAGFTGNGIGFSFLESDIDLFVLAFEFWTPAQSEEVGVNAYFRNGQINGGNTIYAPAQYYAYDNSSVFAGTGPFLSSGMSFIPFLSDIDTQRFGSQVNTIYNPSSGLYFINTQQEIIVAFGYTIAPTAVTGNVFNDLAYYGMMYDPGNLTDPIVGMPDGFTPLAVAQVYKTCQSTDIPQYYPLTDTTNPNTIQCRLVVPDVPLPYGNLLPVSGRITEYQPFILIAQTQAKTFTGDLINSPEIATLLTLTIDNSSLYWSNIYNSTPLEFVYSLVDNQPVIRVNQENGLYLGISQGILSLLSSPPSSNILTDNILFVNWYPVVIEAQMNGLSSPGVITSSENGILYSTGTVFNPTINIEYISPVPIINYLDRLFINTTTDTQEATTTLVNWMTLPTNYMTSPGWNGSKLSLFTNTLDSTVSWFGGDLVTCGINWGLCGTDGFCIQSYDIFPGTLPLPSGKLPLKCNSTMLLPNTTPGDRGEHGEPSTTPGTIGSVGIQGVKGVQGNIGNRGKFGLPGIKSEGIELFSSPSLIFILIFIILLILIMIFILFYMSR